MIKCKRINSVLWEIGIVLFIALGASSAATINFPKAGTVPNNYYYSFARWLYYVAWWTI